MTGDTFSEILELTKAQTVVSGGFTAGGDWSIRFPAPQKIKFFALVKGSCWLSVVGEEGPVHVESGDVILLSAARSFVLASDLSTASVDALTVFTAGPGPMTQIGEGADCVQIGGHVQLDQISGGLLANVLPPLIHVRSTSPHASVLQWLLAQLVRERAAGLPGAGVAASQLAQLMFVQILRAYLESAGPFAPGWLRAVSDRRISPTLQLMHADPGRTWRLEELARAASMSRTSYASHFRAVTGVAPLTYLTEWRMRLAERALRDDERPVAEIGRTLGYRSESAFSNAFKRVIGSAPKRYRASSRLTSVPTE
jgi:AraC-like DNA-binding protein